MKQTSAIKVVVVPLETHANVYFTLGGNPVILPVKSNLYLYYQIDGTMTMEVVTIVPDATFQANDNKNMSFTGIIKVENWNGSIIKAYRFLNGRTLKARSVKSTQSYNQTQAAGSAVTTNSWTEICVTTEHLYYVEAGDITSEPTHSYSENYCWYDYHGEPELLKATDYGENGYGSSSGGGGGGSISPTAAFTASINDSNLAPCMQPIMSDVKKLSQGVGQIVTKFAGNTPGFNWEVKEGILSGGTGATDPPAFYNYTTGSVLTTFDSKAWLDATDLSWARTILHESVHAYLTAYFATNKPGWEASYPQMVQEWGKLQNWNDVHHEEFARSVANDIATALQEYGNIKGYSLSQQFCNDMAWAGLQGTTAFANLPATDRARILDVIAIELTGKDIGGNNKTQIGSKAGC